MRHSYQVGNQIVLSVTFLDATTQLPSNPTDVVLQLRDPQGNFFLYNNSAPPFIQNPSLGLFQCVVQPMYPGIWTYRWSGSGSVVAVTENTLEILPSAFNPLTQLTCIPGNFRVIGELPNITRT